MHTSKLLVFPLALFICSLVIEIKSFAEVPSINHISIEKNKGWQTFASGVRKNVLERSDLFIKASGLQTIEAVDPVMLGVLLVPGKPIETFGASVVELLLVEVSGTSATRDKQSCIFVLTRQPYEDRQWQVDELLSGTHTEPQLRSPLWIHQGIKGKSAFLTFAKKLFTPGVCYSPGDLVIDLIVNDSAIAKLIGLAPTDQELRELIAR